MNKILLALSICTVFIAPSFVEAGPILRSGEEITVDSEQTLKGDFYGFGSNVIVSGAAENDVYVGGGTVTINAPVAGDLTVLGGVVQIHGDVADDVRVLGGEVTIANAVKGDVVVLGGTLTILSTATVEGDILFMGGDLTVSGNVVGAVHGSSDVLRINAEVGGDISYTTTQSFTLGDKAKVLGNISYKGINDLVRAQDATVAGDIHKTETEQTPTNVVKVYVLQLCVLIFAALTLYMIARTYVQYIVEYAQVTPGMAGLLGLGMFLTIPFISVVLIVSVIGAFVGVMLMIGYTLAICTSIIVSGITVGFYLQTYVFKRAHTTLLSVVLGVIVFTSFVFVPYIGGLCVLACMLITLGKMGMIAYHALRA